MAVKPRAGHRLNVNGMRISPAASGKTPNQGHFFGVRARSITPQTDILAGVGEN
jgi:hypothetical protein